MVEFNEHHQLTLSGRYYHQKQDARTEIATGDTKTDDWNGLIKLDSEFGKEWKIETELYTTQYQVEEQLFTDSTGEQNTLSNFDLMLIKPEIRLYYSPWKNHQYTFGTGITHQKLDRTSFFNKPKFNAPFAYFQYDVTFLEDFNLIAGGRYDAHNQYESQFSPKIALRYQWFENLGLKASIGYGYKAPEFRQLYFDFTNSQVGYTVLVYNAVSNRLPAMQEAGEIAQILYSIDKELNQDLRPESATNYNIGFDYKPIKGARLSVNFYRNNVTNLIDTRAIARKKNGQNVFSYYNIDEIYTQGMELDGRLVMNEYFTIAGGYQWLDAKDKSVEEKFEKSEVYYKPDPLESSIALEKDAYFGLYNRSRHTANLKLYLSIPEWGSTLNLRVVYRSKYGITDTNGNDYLDVHDDFVEGYTQWNIALNQQIGTQFNLAFGINNLFDFKDPQNIPNIPGRQLYTKVSWTL